MNYQSPAQIMAPAYITVVDVHTGPVVIQTLPKGTLFCDIDGTVADLTHRRVYVATKPKNWPAFEKTMHLDTPIQPIIDHVRALRAGGWKVVMCSGRGEQKRVVTEVWLARHGIEYDRMYMRAEGDYRRDDIVKEELLNQAIKDGFEPDVVFDDRDQVVAMWRKRGYLCIQVAEGDF